MSNDCEEHRTNLRLVFAFLFLAVVVLVVSVLLVCLLIRPTQPRFILQYATVSAFNLTSSNLLTVNLQVTLSSRNPNSRYGIYYDMVDVYVTYRSQQITLPMGLPTSYQGHKDITVWSPILCATALPVDPYLAFTLRQDEEAGTVPVNIRVDGRMRWKVGTFISGGHHLYVNCPTYINFVNKFNNNNVVGVGSEMKYELTMDCNVDV